MNDVGRYLLIVFLLALITVAGVAAFKTVFPIAPAPYSVSGWPSF